MLLTNDSAYWNVPGVSPITEFRINEDRAISRLGMGDASPGR